MKKKQLEKLSTYTNLITYSKLDHRVEFKSFIKSDNVVTFQEYSQFSRRCEISKRYEKSRSYHSLIPLNHKSSPLRQY